MANNLENNLQLDATLRKPANNKSILWKSENNRFENSRFVNVNKKSRDRFIKIKSAHKNKNKFNSKYEEAKKEYESIKRQRQQDRERKLQRKQEIETALNAYKQKKKMKNKKLSAKTAKGQPIMKNRIEMLLDKIQSTKK